MRIAGVCHMCGKPSMTLCSGCGMITCVGCLRAGTGLCPKCSPAEFYDYSEDDDIL